MTSVFISHSSQDDAAVADLVARLRESGFGSLFVDFDVHDGIPAGADWERELLYKLRLAEAVVFVGSPASVASEWCLVEIAFSHAADKPIFPVALVPGVRLTSLQSSQWVDLAARDGVERLVRALTNRLDPGRHIPWDFRRPPYPGLEPFEAADAGVFFGRDDIVAELLERLDARFGRSRSFAVAGPSGSGKSSVLRAGLAPRLMRDPERWRVLAPMRPGERPLGALARSLNGSAVEDTGSFLRAIDELAAGERSVLLIVDQAEELVTLSRGRERARFAQLLCAAISERGPLWVVSSLRTEYLEAALADPLLAPLVGRPMLLSPLDRSRLPDVILGPARRAGFDFAPGVVERMVEDTRGGDALPLLGYTLRELHERRRELTDDVTATDYEAVGGVLGALQRRADQVLRNLADDRALSTLLRLVSFGPDRKPARRRAAVADFDAREREVIDAFVDARLLVTSTRDGTTVVEPAHEALLRVWSPLAKTIEASRERLEALAELREAADEWVRHERSRAYLLREDRLARARRHAHDDRSLEPRAREFLAASEQAEVADLEQAQRRARRLRLLSIALAGLAMAAVVAAGFAIGQSRRANTERREAQRQERNATSLALASQSELISDKRPGQALVLALAAAQTAPTFEARNAMINMLRRTSRAELVVRGAASATLSGDGRRMVALGRSGNAELWNIHPRALVARVEGQGHFSAPAANGDGRVVAAVDDAGHIGVWRLDHEGGTFRAFGGRTSRRGAEVVETLMSRSGGVFAIVAHDRLALLRTSTGQPIGSPIRNVGLAAVSPSGTRLATAAGDEIRLWRISDAGPRPSRVVSDHHPIRSLSFGDSDDSLTVVHLNGSRERWSLHARPPVRARRKAADPRTVKEPTGPLQPSQASPIDGSVDGFEQRSDDGSQLLRVTDAGAEVWSLRPGRAFQRTLSSAEAGIALAADGTLAIATLTNGQIELRPPGGRVTILAPPTRVELRTAIAFGPGPSTLTAVYDRATIGTWGKRPHWQPTGLRTLKTQWIFALAPDGRRAVALDPTQKGLALWDMTSAPPAMDGLVGAIPGAGDGFLSAPAFSGDGRTFTTRHAGEHCAVAIWRVSDLRHPTCIDIRLASSYHQYEAALNQHGTVLATSDAQDEIRFWDTDSGRQLGAAVDRPAAGLDDFGLGNDPAALAFVPDGRTLLALDVDRKQLRMIDAVEHRPLGTPMPFFGGAMSTTAFAFAPDSSRGAVAVGGSESHGVIEVDGLAWTHDADAFRKRICSFVGEDFIRDQWRKTKIPVPYTRQCR